MDLTPALLREWIMGLNLKARSIRQLLIPLCGELEQAVNDDLITTNPLDRVKLNRLLPKEAKRVDYEVDPFSAAEIKAILSNAEPQERNLFLFTFTTGMRPSEYMALKWSSIDLVENTVRVERARVLGITRDETKTDSGRRTIDLRRGALHALLDQRQYTSLADDLVFRAPLHNSGWQDSTRVGTRWRSILKKAGVRHRVLYQTRHTFASTLLSSGANLLYVAKQMGHKDTTMVTRTYGKWIELEDNALPSLFERLAEKKTAARRGR